MDKDNKSSEPNVKSGGSDSTGSSGGFDFDTARARQLYDKGMRDIELATQLGTSRSTIALWRKENGLAANRHAVWDEETAFALYKKGATDAEIAAELSKAGGSVSAQAVGTWRRKKKLSANPAYVWVRDEQPADAENIPNAEQTTADEDAAKRTPDFEGGTRRGHLVALPSKQPDPSARPSGNPAVRGMHQRRRSRADLPLPTSYDQGMGDIPFDPALADLVGDGETTFEEEDALYMFATILHLCRLDYGWSSEDVDDFLDAVSFAEQIMTSVETQVGTLGEDDEEEDDVYGYYPEELFPMFDMFDAGSLKKPGPIPNGGQKKPPAKNKQDTAKNTKNAKKTKNQKNAKRAKNTKDTKK